VETPTLRSGASFVPLTPGRFAASPLEATLCGPLSGVRQINGLKIFVSLPDGHRGLVVWRSMNDWWQVFVVQIFSSGPALALSVRKLSIRPSV
jgi:hypothetical protein